MNISRRKGRYGVDAPYVPMLMIAGAIVGIGLIVFAHMVQLWITVIILLVLASCYLHTTMPKIAFILVLMALCTSCASSQKSGSTQFPLGAYKIRSAQVDYYGNGTYKIFDTRQVYVLGRYKIDGNVITMTDTGGEYGCKGNSNPAKYKWSSDGTSIKFTLIEDSCDARRTAMLESPFQKLGQ